MVSYICQISNAIDTWDKEEKGFIFAHTSNSNVGFRMIRTCSYLYDKRIGQNLVRSFFQRNSGKHLKTTITSHVNLLL